MAVAPDSRFICTSDVDSYFVDKDMGMPLSGGIVTFYEDDNRTVLKPVYQITGSPPNYSFTALPNPLILSSVGTYQYMNNNIAVYYFPYQGTPDDSDGTLQLYYITVESSTTVPQLTREAWPPDIGAGSTPVENEGGRNFIPNGQFLTHTDIVGTTQPPIVTADGEDIQFIAQGGWTFRRKTGGASIFNNSFTSITGAVAGLNDFPRNAFNFICTSFNATDNIRDLCIQWEDTNKFSAGNPPGSQDYTYFFAAESLDSNSYTFDVRLIRNFGTGGTPSPQSDTSIGTVVISPGYTYFTVSIPSIDEAIGSYGTNGDDYILIALRGPNSSWATQFTDFGFFSGNQQLTSFPTQTDADMLTRSVAGGMPIPNPDGSDFYLSPVLTPEGMAWDKSMVGKIFPNAYVNGFTGSIADDTNELLCDGSSYITADYSHLGIPYARLWAKLYNPDLNIPIYGTGYDFASVYFYGFVPNEIILSTNQPGPQTNTADGATATGFTFTTLFVGDVNIFVNAYLTETQNTITVIGVDPGLVTPAGAGTSGFTVTQMFNSPLVKQEFTVLVTSLPAAGTYFTFDAVTGGAFYVWFTIDGSGSNPAPGGTGILVPLLSSYLNPEIVGLISDAMNGYQDTRIDTVAGNVIPAGAYFTFHAAGNTYIVWYQVGGIGTAPVITGTPIEIKLTGTETNEQVAVQTLIGINSYQFATPNGKGVFLRGMNIGQNNIPGDPDYSSRFSLNNTFDTTLNGIGSYQANQIIQHLHTYLQASIINGSQLEVGNVDILTNTTNDTGYTGGTEDRPFNMYVSYVIKY